MKMLIVSWVEALTKAISARAAPEFEAITAALTVIRVGVGHRLGNAAHPSVDAGAAWASLVAARIQEAKPPRELFDSCLVSLLPLICTQKICGTLGSHSGS